MTPKTKSKTKKRYGLLLNLPGAPETVQSLNGWPGLYVAGVPTPVGGPDDPLTLADAKQRLRELKEAVRDAEAAWDEFEAAQVERGNRPNGPLPFSQPDLPLRLVEIEDIAAAEQAQADALLASSNALRAVRANRDLAPSEVEQIKNESTAIKES